MEIIKKIINEELNLNERRTIGNIDVSVSAELNDVLVEISGKTIRIPFTKSGSKIIVDKNVFVKALKNQIENQFSGYTADESSIEKLYDVFNKLLNDEKYTKKLLNIQTPVDIGFYYEIDDNTKVVYVINPAINDPSEVEEPKNNKINPVLRQRKALS